ncbi:phosphate acyltransferase PlsX [Actinomadura sp. ATCC 31491]|uniref:Phosphate acyltransferase n=1 Tax=Actinomadura luzonensis TaxID=2805427 RepID=A0ABT0G6U3_9ACTN|nr:phosphate acyltransferase PlsX [Actinomadura luzonensis]MCK2220314.1 phosphate acyltransferase PlsX [Actinomadura luzonensis]
MTPANGRGPATGGRDSATGGRDSATGGRDSATGGRDSGAATGGRGPAAGRWCWTPWAGTTARPRWWRGRWRRGARTACRSSWSAASRTWPASWPPATPPSELPIVHAPDAVPMAERGAGGPALPGSSLAVGCGLLARGEGAAFVSAGSTGAVVSQAVRLVGRAEGVLRPALAIALPALSGGASVLVDAGATADPTPEMMAQFALLGAGYARAVLGVPDPVAGLLSIGSEPGKGNRLARRAEELLRRQPARFHGNIEGHDVLSGAVDVIVTDGFTGNVVLKNVEGCVRTALTMVAQAGLADPAALAGVARRYDPQTHGGAALLGLRGTVVVAHGSSRAATIARACVVAHALSGVRVDAGLAAAPEPA